MPTVPTNDEFTLSYINPKKKPRKPKMADIFINPRRKPVKKRKKKTKKQRKSVY